MVEVSARQVLHLKQPPGPAPCPVGPVELQGATHSVVVRACAGCDGLVLGVAGLAQLLPELQHPAHVAGQLSGQRVGHILFCQPRQLYAPVVEPAKELGTAARVGQPGQCLALGGPLLRDQRGAGEGPLYQGHIHGHAPGVHLHILPPLLHDALGNRPGGQLPVVGPLCDHVHAIVLAEQPPLVGVVLGQVAGAPAVALCGLAGLAEVGDQRLALFHLEGILRLLQHLTQRTQLGGQAAVEGVDHAAFPLLQPEHPLFPAQAHGLRQAPPLKRSIVRPLGVAGIQQPRLHPKHSAWVWQICQIYYIRCIFIAYGKTKQEDLKVWVLGVSVGTDLGDVLRRVGFYIHRDDRFLHGCLLSKRPEARCAEPPVGDTQFRKSSSSSVSTSKPSRLLPPLRRSPSRIFWMTSSPAPMPRLPLAL